MLSDMSKFSACKSYLDFHPNEFTPWRLNLVKQEKEGKPSVTDMLDEIVKFHQLWSLLKGNKHSHELSTVDEYMFQEYIYHINIEEEIGTQDKFKTSEILKNETKKMINQSIQEQETENLEKAYNHFHHIRGQWEDDTFGFLEMDECIVETQNIDEWGDEVTQNITRKILRGTEDNAI